MITEPLFQENIIDTLVRNFDYYLFFGPWLYAALGLVVFLYLNYFLIKYKNKEEYVGLYPNQKYVFNKKSKIDITALFGLFVALIVYCSYLYIQENSLFSSYDLMNISTIQAFRHGVAAEYTNLRFLPIAFIDMNFVYAITHNYEVINVYIIFKQIIILYLLYRLFDFVQVNYRLFAIAIITVLPAMLYVGHAAYPEQLLIIFILLSLIFIKRFSKTKNYTNLWWFVVFMNFAIYSKETTVLFYFGILACSILYSIWNEKIVLKSFLHPIRMVRQLPLEYMIFLSLFGFYTFYILLSDNSDENFYVQSHAEDVLHLLKVYWFEILINLLAIMVFAAKVCSKKFIGLPQFNEGILLGCTLITITIVFILKITALPDYKTYYLILPSIFCIFYIIQNTYRQIIWGALLIFTLVASSIVISINFPKEEGLYRREVAEFFGGELKQDNKINIYMSPDSLYDVWELECYSYAYKYFFPDAEIIFRSQYQVSNLHLMYAILYRIMHLVIKQDMQIGDYVVVNKLKESITKEMEEKKVYENKLFLVYVADYDLVANYNQDKDTIED